MVAQQSTVTRKGQITLPVDVRRRLGFTEGQKVSIEEREDHVIVRRARNVAEITAGMMSQYALSPPLTPGGETEAFERAVADEVYESMERQ